MVFGSNKSEVLIFVCPYRLRVEFLKKCEIILNEERMEVVHELKNLSSILCKHRSIEGKTRERAV